MTHFGGVTQCHPVQPTPLQQPWCLGHQEPTGSPGILPKKSRVFTGSGAEQLYSLLLNLSHKHQYLTREGSRTRQLGAGKGGVVLEP